MFKSFSAVHVLMLNPDPSCHGFVLTAVGKIKSTKDVIDSRKHLFRNFCLFLIEFTSKLLAPVRWLQMMRLKC